MDKKEKIMITVVFGIITIFLSGLIINASNRDQAKLDQKGSVNVRQN
ncbi:hypothetical protein LCGC14_2790680 [marine sediment metagenome]|uniref:Uncharacterized protein n=1 Tax=marine sediment metagenome TaxID=412755 RepID=A0A0F8YQN2_9ZZZZ